MDRSNPRRCLNSDILIGRLRHRSPHRERPLVLPRALPAGLFFWTPACSRACQGPVEGALSAAVCGTPSLWRGRRPGRVPPQADAGSTTAMRRTPNHDGPRSGKVIVCTSACLKRGGLAQQPAPVKVRLRRITCDYARPFPPDGQAPEWWQRLKNAFGTASSEFVDASLQQFITGARLPYSGISEVAVNASLAFIEEKSHGTRSNALWCSKWPAPMGPPWRCYAGLAGATASSEMWPRSSRPAAEAITRRPNRGPAAPTERRLAVCPG
jgi:hypothetical protein